MLDAEMQDRKKWTGHPPSWHKSSRCGGRKMHTNMNICQVVMRAIEKKEGKRDPDVFR